MIRVVADTNLLIASIFWNGIPYKIVQSALDNQLEIITSKGILTEVRTVLKEEFKLSEQETDDIINSVMMFAKIVEPTTKLKMVRDPKDDMVVETALDSGAQYIITRDKDLLEIKNYKGIKIVTPEEYYEGNLMVMKP